MASEVIAPDGIAWTIKRRWLPHRRVHWRRLGRRPARTIPGDPDQGNDHWYDSVLNFLPVGDLAGLGTAVTVILGAIVAVLLLWFLLIPLVLALLDLVVVLGLLLAGVLAHLVFRRPWEVEATCAERRVVWLVRGWHESQRQVINVRAGLKTGNIPHGGVP